MLRRLGPAPLAAGLVGGAAATALAAGVSVAAVATGAAGLALACVLAVLDSHAAAAHPELLVGDTPGHAATRARLGKAPSLSRRYRPAPGLRNGHLTTVLPSFFRPHPPGVVYRRECVRMADGGHVTLDWLSDDAGVHAQAPPLSTTAPVVLLLSGIAGGSGDAYVQQFVHQLRCAGLRPVCFNSRGCAGSPVTAPQFYSASWTGDLREIIPHVAAAWPGAPLLAAGWSLGANILCNYLGEEGLAARPARLAAAVSFCNPFALDVCDKALERGMGRIYSRSMGAGLAAVFRPHAQLFANRPHGIDPAVVLQGATVRDFDEAVTRRSFGFATVDDYYRASGSAARLPHIQVPLLCIQAADDPIALDEAVPRAAIAGNALAALVVTPSGGHLGWMGAEGGMRGAPWPYAGAVEWLAAVGAEVPAAAAKMAAEAR